MPVKSNLFRTGVTDVSALGSCTGLQTLNLLRNNIGDQGMEALSTAVASGALANLQELNLGGNRIGDDGMQSLATAVASGLLANLKKHRQCFGLSCLPQQML